MYEFFWYTYILIFVWIYLILIFIIYLVKYHYWKMKRNKNRNSRNMSWFWNHLFDVLVEKIEIHFNWVKYFYLYFIALKLKKVIKVIDIIIIYF